MQNLMNKADYKGQRKSLRNHATSAEAVLWRMLKNRQVQGLKFRRQHGIGPYIVDFYCPELRLAIELDGEVHYNRSEYDEQRSAFLNKANDIYVMRFENRTVFENPARIIEEIESFYNAKQL